MSSTAMEPLEQPSNVSYENGSKAVEESGTVKWYNAMKGFGFTASDRGGRTSLCTLRRWTARGSRA
jgi:hypothetical protein